MKICITTLIKQPRTRVFQSVNEQNGYILYYCFCINWIILPLRKGCISKFFIWKFLIEYTIKGHRLQCGKLSWKYGKSVTLTSMKKNGIFLIIF